MATALAKLASKKPENEACGLDQHYVLSVHSRIKCVVGVSRVMALALGPPTSQSVTSLSRNTLTSVLDKFTGTHSKFSSRVIMNDRTRPMPCSGVTQKPSTGCWTCKVRRKKCDGNSSVCNACAALQITCYHDRAKPEWMDGGARQEEMVEWFKTKVKEHAHRRRAERSVAVSSDRVSPSTAEASSSGGEWLVLPQRPIHTNNTTSPHQANSNQLADTANIGLRPLSQAAAPSTGRKSECILNNKAGLESISFGRADTILITFYLESLFPSLFPFHQPSILEGGRAWILELILKSPVYRQVTCCQSSYSFSLARGTTDQDGAWETLLNQTRDAFRVLRQAMQVINGADLTEHMHGAVRILTSIMQLQRFEVAVMSFENCRAHLTACVSLFQQLLGSGGPRAADLACPSSCFNAVIDHLGLSSWVFPGRSVPVSSAEQAAFGFSSALLIFDDIIASTALQEPPQLYELHRGLLTAETPIDLKAAVGCENWVLLQIGEIAALDAWKQQCKRASNFDLVELVQRAMPIKAMIEADLTRLETTPATLSQKTETLPDVLAPGNPWQTGASGVQFQSSLVTSIWAHAAILYLSVVVSGRQPSSDEVRYHVHMTIDSLTRLSPNALIRAVCWPLCVAGCLAEPGQEAQLRDLIQALQPRSVFGTLYRALEILETVWRNRDSSIAADHDLAACFRSQGDLILLV